MRTLTSLILILAAVAVASFTACGESEPVIATPEPEPTATIVLSTPAPVATAAEPELPATPVPAQDADPANPLPTPTVAVEAIATVENPAPSPEPVATSIPAVFPVTVVDANGNAIVFESAPERIVAYDSAVVEILFAMGEGHRVVGTHEFVFFPPEAADVPRMGGAFNMNVEQVVAAEPDLVFVFFDRFVPDLERAGLKVFHQETLGNDFLQVAETIRMWGHIVGNPGAAQALAADFEARVERIRETMEPYSEGLTIFQDVGGFWTPGSDTLVGEVFEVLKLRNIADDVAGYAQLSPELIVERNPGVIITVDPGAILDNPAFADVQAVRNGMVLSLPSNALDVAGPRFVQGIEELAEFVYAPLFTGVP